MQLEYRDDAHYNALEPQRMVIKEVPYMMNNPDTQKQVTATSIVPSGTIEDISRKERQDKIEQLKQQLTKPVNRDNARRGSVAVSLTQNNMMSEV